MTAAFDAIVLAGPELPAKEVANLVTGDYGRAAKVESSRTQDGLVGRASGAEMADLLRRVVDGELSRANAKEVLVQHLATGETVAAIVEASAGSHGLGVAPPRSGSLSPSASAAE